MDELLLKRFFLFAFLCFGVILFRKMAMIIKKRVGL